MRWFMRIFYVLLWISIFSFFISSRAYAGSTIVYEVPQGSSPADLINCADNASYACNNGPAVGNSGGCGQSCEGGNIWSEYEFASCRQKFGQYFAVVEYASKVCSTGDKCGDAT